jgi:hypothetical protein
LAEPVSLSYLISSQRQVTSPHGQSTIRKPMLLRLLAMQLLKSSTLQMARSLVRVKLRKHFLKVGRPSPSADRSPDRYVINVGIGVVSSGSTSR